MRQADADRKREAAQKIERGKRIAAEAAKDAEERREAAERNARVRASCADIYRNTAEKKLAELTVRESKQVEACSKLSMYPPSN